METTKFTNVGELINLLKNYPEDMSVLLPVGNFEKSGYTNNGFVITDKFKKERATTYDAFDGECYQYDKISKSFDDADENTFDALLIVNF